MGDRQMIHRNQHQHLVQCTRTGRKRSSRRYMGHGRRKRLLHRSHRSLGQCCRVVLFA